MFRRKQISVFFKVYFSVLLLGISCLAAAINSDQWQAVELKVEDGLPDTTVYSMAQDEAGFMWFGTTNGLARYDGYSFKIFRHDGADNNTLSNNNAGNIYLDSRNHLWIGTFGGGANEMNLNNGEITRFPYSSANLTTMISENVQTFFEDSLGNMWIGTPSGLYQLSGAQLNYFNHDKNDNNSLSNDRIWDVEEDSEGNIWVATSQGLSKLNTKSRAFSNFVLPDTLALNISSNQFRTIKIIDGVIWIGSSTGLFSFNVDSSQFKRHHPKDIEIKINDILIEETGDLLIAGMDGLYLFEIGNNSFKTNEDGELWQVYSNLDVRQIQYDRSGLLWLATRDHGVVKIDQDGGVFQLHRDYTTELELTEKSKQVWTTITDGFNQLYLGTSDTLFKQNVAGDFDHVGVVGLDGLPGIVRTIKARATGGHWIGASTGLYYLPTDANMAVIKNEPFDLVGIEPTDVFSVAESSNGTLWLALYNVGVLHWNPEQKTAELLQSLGDHSLVDMNISVIFLDDKNNIWIGSNLTGLFRYKPEVRQLDLFTHDFGNNHSLSSNRVKDIFQDSKGRIWIAAARGLNQFLPESQSFKRFTQLDGLLNESIHSLHEDSKQNLWISYQFGLSKFNPDKQETNNYLLNNAISNGGFNVRSSSIDNNDVIYLGGVNGYYTFDPKMLNINTRYKPSIKITQVWVNGKALTDLSRVSKQLAFDLYYKDRSIGFEFAALDFKSSEQIKYSYRIHGLYEDWLNISNNRKVELSNLNPGNYHLEVKAVNNDGRWSEEVMSIDLKIHPVWWNRGWIRVFFVVLLITVATFFHQFRTHKIRKQNLHLEYVVKNRTSELHDLNLQLKTAAHTDYLTQLPNRLAFIKTIEKKQQLKVIDGNGCIAMADVDFFKKINDQFGHAAGDYILVEISEMMRQMIREDDLIARWGGEEFIFYFEGKGVNQIFPMIDRIRDAVENTQFKFDGHIIPVTLTMGICQNEHGMTLNECIIKADEAMYQGKAEGRNAVIVAKSIKV